MNLISVIVPCWNEEETIPIYYEHMCPVMDAIDADCELIFVDDGSQDATLSEMKKLSEKDARCQYLSFSRNFGKEAAIYAGLCKAKGDYVVVMDVDLQDPPELLPKMYEMVKNGTCDSVATRRSDRTGEPVIRSFLSENFYKFINKISKTQLVYGARDYRIMCRKMVDAVLQMSEYNRFSKGIFSWVGFKTEWLEYENVERSAGETKWSLRQLFKYSLEGITGFLWLLYQWRQCLALYSAGYRFNDIVSGDPDTDLGRSGGGLAFDGLRDPVYGRHPAALHGDHGRVSLENLSGIQTSSDLYRKEFQL